MGGAFGTLRLRQQQREPSGRHAHGSPEPQRSSGAALLSSRVCQGGVGRPMAVCRCRSVQISGAEGIDSEKYFRERAWRPAPRQQQQEGLGNARGLDCHPAFLLLGEAATGLSRAATLHREEACRSMTPEASPELATTPCCAALQPRATNG